MKNNWKHVLLRTVLSIVLVLPLYDFLYTGAPWLYEVATSPRGFALRELFATISMYISFIYLIKVANASLLIQSPTDTFAQTLAEMVLGFVIWLPIVVSLVIGAVLFGIKVLFGYTNQPDGEIVYWLSTVCPYFLSVSYGFAWYITYRIPIEQKLYYRPPATRKVARKGLLRYKKENGYT